LVNTSAAVVQNIAGPQFSAKALNASCTNNDGGVVCLATGGTVPFQYSLNDGVFQASPSFAALDTGTYTVTLQDSNGCLSYQTLTVFFNNTLSAYAGPDTAICQGANALLHASTAASTISWIPSAELSNASILDPVASPEQTTKYYATSISGICTALDSVIVSVYQAPIANPGNDTAICFGKSIRLNGSGGVEYSWSPSDYLDNSNIADPTVVHPIGTTSYELVVTDGNGCKSLVGASVTITITPAARVFAGNDTSVVINQSLQLNAIDINNSGFTQYAWSPVSGLNNPNIENAVAYLTANITYVVTAYTPDGCQGSDSVTISVYPFSDILVPNAFTPNGDGRNDFLRPILIGIKEFKYFAVFNRYGQQVFRSINQSAGWDGKINGSPQNAGAFVWMAAGIDYTGNAVVKKGQVVLIR
jgi:gliding motility-associated-like protein